jgi:hypothetical protein
MRVGRRLRAHPEPASRPTAGEIQGDAAAGRPVDVEGAKLDEELERRAPVDRDDLADVDNPGVTLRI